MVVVTAPPVDGKATKAALGALADALGVRAGMLSVRAGAASRDKLIRLDRPPADLDERVRVLREGLP